MTPSLEIHLPEPHAAQEIFVFWSADNPAAQCLIAPAGTKLGKSMGCAIWLLKEALETPRLFCIWIAPTYLKAKIGFRYIKAMLPDVPDFDPVDSRLEIRLANGSFIKFLHGKDAEVVVEGEATDRFVIDEAGKQSRQLWYSLFTTITQTRGKGIVTGTPRGFTWYYEEARKARAGDPFYVYAHLRTDQSPYVDKAAIEQARRLLPKALFDQYYNALFVTMSSVFGDIASMFDESLPVNVGVKFWIHPDPQTRADDTVTGWDIAKQRDYTVFYTVNTLGKLVGYARFRKVAYEIQVDRLRHYLHTYFSGDRLLRYDATGVGNVVGEMISAKDIDASITPVIFSQRSKQEMVGRLTMAIESGWHKAPRIEQIEHEFGSYELNVTKSGLFSYSAPDGEHDDVVCAAMLAVSGAYQMAAAAESERVLERVMLGLENDTSDIMAEAASEFLGDDDFFDTDSAEEKDDFDFDGS